MIGRLRARASGWRPFRRARASDVAAGPARAGEHELESSLVWIWGSPRSGSTWLLKLLGDPLDPDPEVTLGFRPPERDASPYDVLPVDETFISNHLAPALDDPHLVDGRWTPGTLNNLLAVRPAYVFSDAYEEVWAPAARSFVLARINGTLERARRAGIAFGERPLVAIKETNGSHAADIVMRVLPRSRALLLIRDARDVVDSLLDAHGPGGFFASKWGFSLSTEEERVQGLRWAARLWACNTDMTLRAFESHEAGLCKVVRYEDLLADTAGELGALCRWLGLERDRQRIEQVIEAQSFAAIPPEQKGPKSRNRAATPGLWRENLGREEQRIVNEICGPLLERFGYDL